MHLWLIVGGFVLLFAGSVFLFRTSKPEKASEVLSAASLLASQSTATPVSFSQPDATLIGLTSNKPVGMATRSVENGLFHMTLRATLSGIDRESQFYQVWLVRPVPYDYLSVGEMATNEMGAFVLDWDGLPETDYSGYIDLVITLQTRNGSSDPQGRVVEGEFGK
jgi:hypothetical protein